MRLPAFRSRNYRLFFAGQLVSLIGTWMQQIAMVWLAYRLTGSTAVLGLVGFASQIPILLFGLIAGVWNDRLDRRRILLATQALALLQALLLYGLTRAALITPELLIMLAFLLGCIHAVDMPARQAYVAELVLDKAHLPNAIGLNSLLMNASRFLGPTLAGLIVSMAGEAACFLLNALSYLAVLAALALIRTPARPAVPPEPIFTAIAAALTHAWRTRAIRQPLTMVAAFSFLVTPYAILLPVFARDIYGGSAATYGFLLGSAGIGSLAAALFLAVRGGRHAARGLERLVARTSFLGGVALAAFSLTPWPNLAYPLLAGLGFAVVLTAAGSNTLIQVNVAEAYRGRVMALFSTAFLGMAPLGSLAAGMLAASFGVRPTLLACALATCALGLNYLRQLRSAAL